MICKHVVVESSFSIDIADYINTYQQGTRRYPSASSGF
jgi:hypothetical protein